MSDTPSIVVGMAGAALLLGSLAPAVLEARGSMIPLLIAKGDRLAAPRPSESQATVSIIEIIGLSQATVTFKSHDGAVLFRADPTAGTTAIAKNVDWPVMTLKGEPARPVVRQPARSQEGDNPSSGNPRRSRTIGCETALSALVRGAPGRVPSLCLA